MPPDYEDAYRRHGYYRHDGVSRKYEDAFTPQVTHALVHFFQHRRRMTLDQAIREVDEIDKFLREYK